MSPAIRFCVLAVSEIDCRSVLTRTGLLERVLMTSDLSGSVENSVSLGAMEICINDIREQGVVRRNG